MSPTRRVCIGPCGIVSPWYSGRVVRHRPPAPGSVRPDCYMRCYTVVGHVPIVPGGFREVRPLGGVLHAAARSTDPGARLRAGDALAGRVCHPRRLPHFPTTGPSPEGGGLPWRWGCRRSPNGTGCTATRGRIPSAPPVRRSTHLRWVPGCTGRTTRAPSRCRHIPFWCKVEGLLHNTLARPSN